MNFKIRGTNREKLELFIRASKFGKEIDVNAAADFIESDLGGLPDDENALLRVAMAIVAFKCELIRVCENEVQLDTREEAILNAVVDHVGRAS